MMKQSLIACAQGQMNNLAEVDAIVFVLSCHALASQTELQVISDSIIASGHEDIFFVCNPR